jgi:hypothetical protein
MSLFAQLFFDYLLLEALSNWAKGGNDTLLYPTIC